MICEYYKFYFKIHLEKKNQEIVSVPLICSGRYIDRYDKNRSDNEYIFFGPQADTFLLHAVNLGLLEKVVIGHTGHGLGAGWKLDHVTIHECDSDDQTFVFNCQR